MRGIPSVTFDSFDTQQLNVFATAAVEDVDADYFSR